MSARKRILALGMLVIPCLFLAGALWVQGEVGARLPGGGGGPGGQRHGGGAGSI